MTAGWGDVLRLAWDRSQEVTVTTTWGEKFHGRVENVEGRMVHLREMSVGHAYPLDIVDIDTIGHVQVRRWSDTTETLADLIDRMRELADELDGPLECTQPGYGAPGYSHRAACCYGTGRVITCAEDQAAVDAADALRRCACIMAAGASAVRT